MSRRDRQREQTLEQESFEAYGEYKYDYQPSENETAAVRRAQQAHKRRRISGFFRFLVFLCLLTVAVIVAMETLFRLETVYVIGNEQKSPQQIVISSGLVRGRNMLGIEEEEVAEAFARDHTIIFKGMQKEYPGTIYLYVEERKISASMQYLGMLYTLDSQGLVMEEYNTAVPPMGIPVVTGFSANAVTVGQTIAVRNVRQLEAYQTIMYELAQQLCSDEFSEINLADPENLYLVTIEGVTVRAGNASSMRAKIGAVRTAMAYLRQLGKEGGTLDVTKPAEAKYLPE
ncbi:MAG: FtsQ-type POTRA domain-containing protein [Clostridia bacterium]|nr:FtsQ-type POTRA domain-containing protein [Clostridia bacterium]